MLRRRVEPPLPRPGTFSRERALLEGLAERRVEHEAREARHGHRGRDDRHEPALRRAEQNNRRGKLGSAVELEGLRLCFLQLLF